MAYTPLISILTPSYNSGDYLERAILSVLNQSYTNWEHIVVDGGSSDMTLSLLEEYDHIRYISEPDQGQSDAMNKAHEMAQGDIMMCLNADDEVAEGAFDIIVAYYSGHKDCQFVCGNLIVNRMGQTHLSKPTSSFYLVLDLMGFRFPLNSINYYYTRQVWVEVGPLPVDIHYAMDYWFLLRVYHRYRVHYVDKVLGTWHYTDNNKSSDTEKSLQSALTVQQDFLNEQNIILADQFIRLQNWIRKLRMSKVAQMIKRSLKRS